MVYRIQNFEKSTPLATEAVLLSSTSRLMHCLMQFVCWLDSDSGVEMTVKRMSRVHYDHATPCPTAAVVI